MEITAKIGNRESNGKNLYGKKEQVSAWIAVDLSPGVKDYRREVVTVRCYMGRSRNASRVYASIWVHHGDDTTSGHGYADGYGYHKESAAVDEAIRSAGIELSRFIDGVGDSAIESAVKAIALAAGYDNVHIVRA
jgi:hypothetical protein